MQSVGIASIDLNAYAAIVIEGAFSKVVNAKGQIHLQMHRDLIGNDSQFVKYILQFLLSKAPGKEYHTIEDFRGEAIAYLQQKSKYPQQSVADPKYGSNSPDSNFHHGTRVYGHDYNSATVSKGYYSNSVSHSSSGNNGTNIGGISNSVGRKFSSRSVSVLIDPDLPDGKTSPRIDYEKSDPIVRLLAQVRKVGMDILFPQSTHDKVRIVNMCILVRDKFTVLMNNT